MKSKLFTGLILPVGSSIILMLLYISNYYSIVPNNINDEDGLSLKNMDELNLLRYRDPATGKIPDHIRQKELFFASNLPGSYKNLKSDYDYLQSEIWTRRGPINIGGRTRALAVDVRNENIILAGGVSGGMWRSTDNGNTWVKTTAADQMHSVSCIVQDTRQGKEDNWYYGTGEFYGNSASISGNGVFKSTDNGQTWQPFMSTVSKPYQWDSQFDYIWNIVLDYTRNNYDIIHVATALGGIYRTTNGGSTWESVLGGFGNSYSYYTDVAMTSKGVYYATLSQRTVGENNNSIVKGIYRSTDGMDWTDITPQNFPAIYSRIVIGIAPSDENQVYFLAAVTNGFGKATLDQIGDTLWNCFFKYTYVSGNGSGLGGIWEDRSQNLPGPSIRRGHFNPQGSYNLIVKVKPDNPDVVFIGGTNLYRSNNGFASTESYAWIGGYNSTYTGSGYQVYPNQHPDQHAIVFMPSNSSIMLSGSDGGVAKTMNDMADNVEWISLNHGYYTTQFYTVAIDHTSSGDKKIIGGLQDNETLFTNTDDPNVGWKSLTQGDGLNCAIADGGSFIITSQNSFYQPKIRIWKLKYDNEGNVTVKTRIDPIGAKDLIWLSPFQLDPHNKNLMYLGGGKLIWRNNDLSSIPEVDSKDSTSIGWDSLPQTRLPGKNDTVITALQVSTNPANIVYYGTSNGKVFQLHNANAGMPTPVEITGNKFPKNAYVSSIAIDEEDANKVIVTFSNYGIISIFYTTNGGQSWVPISGNLEEYSSGAGNGPAVNWIEILKVNGNNIYFAGTSTGIYSTAYLDGEFTVWQQEGATTIGNVVVDMLDARNSDGLIAAATHGAGVFTATVNLFPSVPSKPTLNYPSDNSKGVYDKQVVRWNKVEGGSFYKIQIATEQTFSDIFFEKDGIVQDSLEVSELEQGKVKYYWRVLAKGSGGPSEWSDVWSFTTAIQSPNLMYPDNQSDSIPLNVSLQWENVEGAKSYHLIIAENFLFSKIVYDTTGIIGNTFEPRLDYGKRYYWKVSSTDDDGEGIFSRSRNFKTIDYVGVEEDFSSNWLGQNYPNPFNTITSISFEIKRKADVKLEIFNYLGLKIKTIVSTTMDAGKYTYNVDSEGMNSGKYYYRLKTGNKIETKSMLINK
ncbi:MAG: T9SS type A sorting domain-containing protein [Bacteroidetes bacterium]|nr:MAG: T9SS type A sorting domain-containing protein [Bacteroidota bacterium]